jgi:hypothetical protein
MPANWVYDNVLEAMAEVVKADNPGLADTLLDATTKVSVGYLDLRELERPPYRLFAKRL